MVSKAVRWNQSAWLYKPEQPGLLRLSGRDQLAFIQRQTTNDTNLLKQDTGIISVLTTPMARIIDVFFLYKDFNPGEPVLNLVTLPGRGQATARYLKSRIFFNDQVNMQDASSTARQFWLDGTLADVILHEAGASDLPQVDGVRKVHLAGRKIIMAGRRGLTGVGYLLIAAQQEAEALENVLVDKGAEILNHTEYETLRIESGLPGVSTELVDAFTPFEVGLRYAVSDNKGCYTGQEVLARQVTYDKITRQLTGLRLENPVQPGSTVLADGKPAGEITSAVVSPRLGPVALAMLKRPFFEPGTALQVKLEETTIPGVTCQLPF